MSDDTKLVIYQFAAFLFRQSLEISDLLENSAVKLKVREDIKKEVYSQCVVEILYALLHLTDRELHVIYGATIRDLAIEHVVNYLNEVFNRQDVLTQEHAKLLSNILVKEKANLSGQWKDELKQTKVNEKLANKVRVPIFDTDELNERNLYYSSIKEVFPIFNIKDEKSLLWETGKIVSSVLVANPNSILVVQCASLVSELYKNMPKLIADYRFDELLKS